MLIRPAVSGDREFIVGLCPRFAEAGLPRWRQSDAVVRGTARRLEAALASRGRRSEILIAQDEAGERLGFAWVLLQDDFYTGADFCKLSEIATARDGTGAGAALMRACEEWALARGCSTMLLNVLQDNAHARSFYERHGFEPEYTAMSKTLSRQAPARAD